MPIRLIRGLAFSLSLAGAVSAGAPAPTGTAPPPDSAVRSLPLFSLEKSPPDSLPTAFDTAMLAALPAFAKIRSTDFSGWADTGIYVGSQPGRFPQLHAAAFPGAALRPLTRFPDRIAGIYLNPVPSRKNFLYTEDRAGDEQFRLSLFDLRTGLGRPLGAPPGRVEGLIWDDSGTAFAYSHTPAGSDRWDIRLGRSDGRDTLLLSLPGTWSALDLRPDGKRLLLQKYLSASEAELFSLDLETGRLDTLLPGEGPAFADQAQWIRGPGGWSVVFTSDRDGEFHRAYRLRAESGAKPEPWSVPAPWDVEWLSLAPDRRSLVYSVNEEGYSRLYLSDAGAARPRSLRLKGVPDGVIGEAAFRPGAPARRFAFTLNTPAHPGDVYVYDIPEAKTVRWTRSGSGGLPASAFATPKLVRYPSFDSVPAKAGTAAEGGAVRRTIPAWIFLPDPKLYPGPRPTVILVHGGPEQQARPGFDPFLQFLVGRMGFAVAEPNVRGSSGYGRAWQKADDGYLRMGSVRDLGALLDWMAAGARDGKGMRLPLDPARVAVSGRSYGGFMALSALEAFGPRLRAGISAVGISHFPTFLRNTSGYRRDLRRVEYGDERDPRMAAFLDSISPLTRADRIVSPLLLCHGRNDPRVPYGESERIFAAVKGRKIPVWFLTFPDEGHAVRDRESQLAQWRVTAEFLARELAAPVR